MISLTMNSPTLKKKVVHYLVLIISAKIKQILLVHCLRSLAASIGNLEAILQLRLVAKQAQKLLNRLDDQTENVQDQIRI